MKGVSGYYNNARFRDALLAGTFYQQDRLSEKYYPYSPYHYGKNNPNRFTDISGDSVAVLNKGIGTDQHIGLLIQNSDSKWGYYSVNGTNMYSSGSGSSSGSSNGSSSFVGGKTTNDLGEKYYNSPLEYLNSSDNKSEYMYKNAYVIPTTKEQDVTIRQTFITESLKKYNLVTQNCATSVGKSLSEAGVNVDLKISISKRIPVINKQIKISELNIQVPSIIYNHIKNNNPGYEINR